MSSHKTYLISLCTDTSVKYKTTKVSSFCINNYLLFSFLIEIRPGEFPLILFVMYIIDIFA